MDFVQHTLPVLSQSPAGLYLASLVVIAVLLIGFILFQKAQRKKDAQHKARPETDQEEMQAAPETEPHMSEAEPQGDQALNTGMEKVVELTPEAEDPSKRVLRFQNLAGAALSEGRLGDAKELFQQTLILATDNDIAEISANARLELGNLAKAQNDLLSACENWQIARTLYEEVGDKKKVRELDSIMADSQCPSDWVLNKF